MLARRRKCCCWNAIASACLVGLAWPAAAEASDVYFPATTAYHRRNYDPFDQAPPEPAEQANTVEQASVVDQGRAVEPASAVESATAGDVQTSSEIRLLGADPFEKLAPARIASARTAPAELPHVSAARFLAAPNSAPPVNIAEPLPTPPGEVPTPPSALTQADGPDEPGAQWSPKPLSELSTNTVLPGGVLPRNYWDERGPQPVAFCDAGGASRGWPANTFNWVASCLAHNPLYFEEINLERYGYGCGCYGPCCTNGIQSACSAAHFFGTVPALPYMMAVDCPRDCDYTLGYYRPGSCPPWQRNCCTRCSALGGLSASGAAIGLIFLIP
jgi:hypothetical protein